MTNYSKNPPMGELVEIDGIQYQVIGGKLHRYADLTMDKGFKIVLGRPGSEYVLKNLLNRLLGTQIIHLEYRNTEYPGMTEEERSSRFDVYCEDECGNGFQVEMQNWSQKFFHKRIVYYSSLLLQDQASKAHKVVRAHEVARDRKTWDYNFRPLYVVSFLNFRNWTTENTGSKTNPFISTYRYMDIETGSELGDGTNLVFIDLYGFKKTIEECNSLEDRWIYSIKNMFQLEHCPKEIMGTEVEDLFVQSELAKMTIEQRIKYEEEIMTRNDILNSIAEQLEDARQEAIATGLAEGRAEGRAEGLAEGIQAGLEEGRAEGRVEGRAEGEREKAFEIAQRLIADGIPIQKVAELTGVDADLLK